MHTFCFCGIVQLYTKLVLLRLFINIGLKYSSQIYLFPSCISLYENPEPLISIYELIQTKRIRICLKLGVVFLSRSGIMKKLV
jgi:hypothetical protein